MKYENKDNVALLKLVLISSLIAFLGSFFPFLFIFFPMLFLTEALKQGIVRIMAIFIAVCILFGIIFSPMSGIILLSLFGPLIMSLDYSIRTGQSVRNTMAIGTGIFMLSIVLLLYNTGTLESIQDGTLFDRLMEMQENALEMLDISSTQQSQLMTNFRTGIGTIRQLFPSLLLIGSLIIVYLSYSLTGKKLLKTGKVIKQPDSFIFFKLPNQLVISGLIIGLGLFIARHLLGFDIEVLELNFIFTIACLLFFQGLAVIYNLIYRFIKSWILRILAIVVILILPGFQLGLIIVGFLDQWLNLRRIKK